jgi:hypothetical protein
MIINLGRGVLIMDVNNVSSLYIKPMEFLLGDYEEVPFDYAIAIKDISKVVMVETADRSYRLKNDILDMYYSKHNNSVLILTRCISTSHAFWIEFKYESDLKNNGLPSLFDYYNRDYGCWLRMLKTKTQSVLYVNEDVGGGLSFFTTENDARNSINDRLCSDFLRIAHKIVV